MTIEERAAAYFQALGPGEWINDKDSGQTFYTAAEVIAFGRHCAEAMLDEARRNILATDTGGRTGYGGGLVEAANIIDRLKAAALGTEPTK